MTQGSDEGIFVCGMRRWKQFGAVCSWATAVWHRGDVMTQGSDDCTYECSMLRWRQFGAVCFVKNKAYLLRMVMEVRVAPEGTRGTDP